jgi:hypothetical protein
MKIKTTIPVTYNHGINSQEQSLVTGVLRMCMQELTDNEAIPNYYNFNYKYTSDSGVELGGNNFSLSNTEINALYEIVKDELPIDLNYTDSTMYLYLLGMRIQMASTFNIAVSDIEIIS